MPSSGQRKVGKVSSIRSGLAIQKMASAKRSVPLAFDGRAGLEPFMRMG